MQKLLCIGRLGPGRPGQPSLAIGLTLLVLLTLSAGPLAAQPGGALPRPAEVQDTARSGRYQRALAMLAEVPARQDRVQALTQARWRAYLLTELGRYREAQQTLRRIENTFAELIRESALRQGWMAHIWGRFYLATGNYSDAAERLRRAQQELGALPGAATRYWERAAVAGSLLELNLERGEWDQARLQLGIAQQLLNNKPDGLARGNLGLLRARYHLARREYATVLRLLTDIGTSVRQLTTKTFARQDAATCWAARALLALGNAPNALERFRRGLPGLAERLGQQHPLVSEMRFYQAAALARVASYAAAAPLFQKAEQGLKASFGAAHPRLAQGYQLWGRAALAAGELNTARRYLQQSLARWEQREDAHEAAITTRLWYARALGRMGRREEALSTLNAAQRTARVQLPKGHARRHATLLMLARQYRRMGQKAQAERHYENARKGFSSLPAAHPYRAYAHMGLARLYLGQEAYAKALKVCEQGLALYSGQVNLSREAALPAAADLLLVPPEAGKLVQLRATILQRQDKLAPALSDYRLAARLAVAHAPGYEPLRLPFSDAIAPPALFEAGLATAHRLVQAQGQADVRAQAFELMELAHVHEQLRLLQRIGPEAFAGVPPEAERALQQQRQRLATLRVKLLHSLPARAGNDAQALQKQRRAYRERWLGLRQEHPRFFALQFGPPRPRLAAAQRTLTNEQQALVSYHAGPQYLHGLVLTPEGGQLLQQEHEGQLGKVVQLARQALRQEQAQQYAGAAQQLGRWVLWPALDALPGAVEELHILPHGPLWRLAFPALPMAQPGGFRSWQAWPFLVREYAVSYAASAAQLKAQRERTSRAGEGGLLAVLAFYDPDAAAQTSGPTNTTKAAAFQQALRDTFQAYNRSATFLPSEEAAFRRQVKGFGGYLHLALQRRAHGEETLTDAGFVWARATAARQREQSLTLQELFDLPLAAAHLAIGTGQVLTEQPPGNGTAPLAAPLALAADFHGLHTLLLARWPAPEAAHSALLAHYYGARLRGLSAARARAQAQRRLLQGNNPSPSAWAGWFLRTLP